MRVKIDKDYKIDKVTLTLLILLAIAVLAFWFPVIKGLKDYVF